MLTCWEGSRSHSPGESETNSTGEASVVERTTEPKRKRLYSAAPDTPLPIPLPTVVSAAAASTAVVVPTTLSVENSGQPATAFARLRKLNPKTMPWYGNNVQRQQQQQHQHQNQNQHQHQQCFGGTPMASAPSAPGIGFGGPGTMTNGVTSYHGPANGAQGAINSDGKIGGLVFPALHLHPVNDTFAPKQISLSPPGPDNKVKIGRQTNAKTVPHPSNGYFDSKVLSRMHAEVWCQDGKMFIKDVKSSNGTFINGERLSAEAQESDVFELHNEDLVEFGIDIVGEDNKTIVHHKVACRVYLVFTAEDAISMRNDFAAMYRGAISSHMNSMPQAGIGPGAEGGLRRGKSTMNFDHILSKLQMELQKSRETNSEIGSLNSTIEDIQESFGGGLPPLQEPPYQHVVPQAFTDDPNGVSGDTSSSSSSTAVAALQAQLAETQSSISSQVDKIRALESMLAEHELIKAEVGSIKSQMAEAKRELDEMAHSRSGPEAIGSQSNGFSLEYLDANNFSSGKEESDNFDESASIASVETITPGADVGEAPSGADEVESELLQDDYFGPQAPPDLPPGSVARDAATVASASSLQKGSEEQLQAQNRALSTRLKDLESQLEEALNFGHTLQNQHNMATEAVKDLEAKVQSLEREMKSHADNVQGKIKEALEGCFSAWKEQIEVGWKQEKRDWEEECDKFRRVIEAWDQANEKLEEQAAQQVAAGSTSPSLASSSSRNLHSESGSTSALTESERSSRRRASKSARRRAAKRHLNPTLRALLYKDSHNDFLPDDDTSMDAACLGRQDDLSSDEEDAGSSYPPATGKGSSVSVAAPDAIHDGASISSSSEATTSTGGGKSSLFSSEGFLSRASRMTTPEGSSAGDHADFGEQAPSTHTRSSAAGFVRGTAKGGLGKDGGSGRQGFDNIHVFTALSAAAVIVGVAVYAVLGKDATSRG